MLSIEPSHAPTLSTGLGSVADFFGVYKKTIEIANLQALTSVENDPEFKKRLFLSSDTRIVDEKNRLLLPFPYKELLGKESCWCLINPASPRSLILITESVHDELIRWSVDEKATDRQGALWVGSFAIALSIDKQHRLFLPKPFLRKLGIADIPLQATILGRVSHAEIFLSPQSIIEFTGERSAPFNRRGEVPVPEPFLSVFKDGAALISKGDNRGLLYLLNAEHARMLAERSLKNDGDPEIPLILANGLRPIQLRDGTITLPDYLDTKKKNDKAIGTVRFTGRTDFVRLEVFAGKSES